MAQFGEDFGYLTRIEICRSVIEGSTTVWIGVIMDIKPHNNAGHIIGVSRTDIARAGEEIRKATASGKEACHVCRGEGNSEQDRTKCAMATVVAAISRQEGFLL